MVEEVSVDSLPELIEAAISIAPKDEQLWFRGVSNAGYSLVPKVYRTASNADGKNFLAQEEPRMLARFRQQAVPFLPSSEISNAALLVHMQHYGAPTRLLDWTENLLIATYFSADGGESDEQSPTIWALLPQTWNQLTSIDFDSGEIPTFDTQSGSPSEPALNGWLPVDRNSSSMFGKQQTALAVYAMHSNDRIRAQQGVFTVAGLEARGLEEQVEHLPRQGEKSLSRPILYKLRYVESAERLREELRLIGYRRSLIYPGLESICTEIG